VTLRRIGLGVLVVFLLGLGALAWRLDRGPISLPFLAKRIEAAYDRGGPGRVEVGALRLAWQGWGNGGLQPIEILLSQVRALGPAGKPRLELPDVRVAIPLGGLLRGRLAPQRLELHNPLVRLQRDADGNISLGLGEPRPATTAPDLPPGETVAEHLLQTVARPPQNSLMAALEHLAILDGRLQVDDRQLLEADGVVGDDVRHRDLGELGAGLEQLLVLLLGHLDRFALGRDGSAGGLGLGLRAVLA